MEMVDEMVVNVTYKDLIELSTHLKDSLIKMNFQKGTIIGLYALPSIELVIGILGIMMAECVYCPILPARSNVELIPLNDLFVCVVQKELWQDENHLAILKRTYGFATFIILDRRGNVNVVDGKRREYQDKKEKLEINFAYQMFTSGSTGKPDKVLVSHQSICSNLISLTSKLMVTSEDKFLLNAPITFDPSIIDIFLPLINGGSIVILPDYIKNTSSLFIPTMNRINISVIQCTPSFLRQICSESKYSSILFGNTNLLRALILGGEDIPNLEEFKTWIGSSLPKDNFMLCNIYGITEISVWATLRCVLMTKFLQKKQISYKLDLGIPLKDTLIKIIDEHEQEWRFPFSKSLVTEGKIFIGSTERICILNEEKYKPGQGVIWRDSGDFVRISRGKIHYLSRLDNIIKINGKKVNINEVSSILRKAPGVKNCYVVKLSFAPVLVAAILPVNKKILKFSPEEMNALKNYNNEQLSYHMRPTFFLPLDEFPLTSSGKVNLLELTRIVSNKLNEVVTDEMLPPSKESLSQYLQELWSTSLTLDDRNQLNDYYYLQLGGTSIDAYRIAITISKHYSIYSNYTQRIFTWVLNENFNNLVNKIWSLPEDDVNTSEDSNNNRQIEIEIPKFPFPVAFQPQNKITTYGNESFENLLKNNIINPKVFLDWKYYMSKCVDASPLIILENGKMNLFIGCHSGMISCIKLEDGTCTWNTLLPNRIESSACLTILKSIAVGCNDGKVYFLNSSTGKIIWSFDTGDIVKCSGIIDKKKNILWIGSHSGNLYALDESKCSCIWKFKTGSIISKPMIMYKPFYGIIAADQTGYLHMLTESNESLYTTLWSIKIGGPIFASIEYEEQKELICVASVDNYIRAFNTKGDLVWKLQTGAPIFSSPTLLKKDELILGSHDKNLYKINTCNGNIIWKVPLQSQIYSSPAIVISNYQNLVIVACTEGVIYVINGLDGVIIHKIILKGEVFSSLVAIGGKIVFGCRDDNVYCLQLEQES